MLDSCLKCGCCGQRGGKEGGAKYRKQMLVDIVGQAACGKRFWVPVIVITTSKVWLKLTAQREEGGASEGQKLLVPSPQRGVKIGRKREVVRNAS